MCLGKQYDMQKCRRPADTKLVQKIEIKPNLGVLLLYITSCYFNPVIKKQTNDRTWLNTAKDLIERELNNTDLTPLNIHDAKIHIKTKTGKTDKVLLKLNNEDKPGISVYQYESWSISSVHKYPEKVCLLFNRVSSQKYIEDKIIQSLSQTISRNMEDLILVGEEGPELIKFLAGTKVITNKKSNRRSNYST